MKDKFYKYRFTLLSLLILLFYFLVKAIYKYDPFNPNVWGNVADWMMVIVTAITLFFIYKTLESQKDVQKTNNRLLEIETNRHKYEVQPKFKFSSTPTEKINGEYIELYYKIELTNTSNFEARNFKVTEDYNPSGFKSHLSNKRQTTILPGNPFQFITECRPKLRSTEPLSYFAHIEYSVTYSDVYGNFYRHVLKHYRRYGFGDKWQFLPPVSGYFEGEKWHNNAGEESFFY